MGPPLCTLGGLGEKEEKGQPSIVPCCVYLHLDGLGERPPLHFGLELHVGDLQLEAVPVHGEEDRLELTNGRCTRGGWAEEDERNAQRTTSNCLPFPQVFYLYSGSDAAGLGAPGDRGKQEGGLKRDSAIGPNKVLREILS